MTPVSLALQANPEPLPETTAASADAQATPLMPPPTTMAGAEVIGGRPALRCAGSTGRSRR